jgi:hypothetical protein
MERNGLESYTKLNEFFAMFRLLSQPLKIEAKRGFKNVFQIWFIHQ